MSIEAGVVEMIVAYQKETGSLPESITLTRQDYACLLHELSWRWGCSDIREPRVYSIKIRCGETE
jgi:hypothetical protein